jgi:hypothetical protein
LTQGFNVRTRFSYDINDKYYLTGDWNAYLGHRYLGGKNARAFDTEIAPPLGHGIRGQRSSRGERARMFSRNLGWQFYLVHADNLLIVRHRQDDPPNWTTDSLFGITSQASPLPLGQVAHLVHIRGTFRELD